MCDESRQDAHVSDDALRWEHEFFLWMGIPEHVVHELRECINVRGYTKTTNIGYARVGSRNTGDPHTSSANSLMNALKMIYTLWRLLPSFDFKNPPFALAIQGDDSLVLIRPDLAHYITANAVIDISGELGFHVKYVKLTYKVVEVDYCSRYFWPTDDHPLGYLPGPKIGKILNKIGYSKTPIDDPYVHAKGIALGLYNDVQHIPFLREWVDCLLRLTMTTEAVAIKNNYALTSPRHVNENSLTWEHLNQRYGVVPEDLSSFESLLSGVSSLPFYVGFPIDLQSLVKQDT